MADRVSASIVIGGNLTAAEFAELAQILADEALSTEWDGEPFEPDHRVCGEPLRLHAHEVAWGRFETLEPWCFEHGIAFARWAGGYSGQWGAERVVFTGSGDPVTYLADEDDHILIDRSQLEKLGSIEAILAHFDAADAPIPALRVEGDPAPVEA